MVSEAKKPLVASMAYLAIYSLIILAATTYMIIGGLKDTKITVGGGTPENSKSDNGEGEKPASPSSGKPKTRAGKKIFDKMSVMNAFAKTPEAYLEKFRIISKGVYLEPKPQALLEQFQREFYLKVEAKEDSAEEKHPTEKMTATEEAKSDPASPVRLFKLENTFGLPGSSGYFSYYDSKADADMKKALTFTADFDKFVEEEGLKVHMDEFVKVNGELCHIKVLLEKTDESNSVSDENIISLADQLIQTKTFWKLGAITLPQVFGLFIGLKPPAPSPNVLPALRDMEIIRKRLQRIDNIFHENAKAIYFGQILDLHEENFETIQDYAAFLKSAKGYKYFDHVEMFLRGEKKSLTIHYAAKREEEFYALKLKLDELFDDLVEGNLTKSDKNFYFILENDFCILFICDAESKIFDTVALTDGAAAVEPRVHIKSWEQQFCGADKKKICGMFDVVGLINGPGSYRVFYALDSKEFIRKFVLRIDGEKPDKIDLPRLIGEHDSYDNGGVNTFYRTKPDTANTTLESRIEDTLYRIRRSGFIGFYDDRFGDDIAIWKDEDLFVLVPDPSVFNWKLFNTENSDFKTPGNGDDPILSEIYDEEIVVKWLLFNYRYNIRVREIKNIFKHTGLNALHIEFMKKDDYDALADDTSIFDSFSSFIGSAEMKHTAYDGLDVYYNYGHDDRDIIDVLDEIRDNGVKAEFEKQNSYWAASTIVNSFKPFNVLLIGPSDILENLTKNLRGP